MTKEDAAKKHAEEQYPSDSKFKESDALFQMRKAFCEVNFINGWEAAESDNEEMIKQFIEKWEEQKTLWRSVLDKPLFHTKEELQSASGKSLAITAMLVNFKETFSKESLKQ